MTTCESVRVLVVDDHRTVADAVALALAGEDGLECVGTAHTVTEARSLALTTVPDVVVMDVNLGPAGSTDGIDVAAELVQSIVGIRVIILTAFVDQALLRRALGAGAVALLPKDGTLTELLEAVRGCSDDGFVV
ncbi:MAG: response regulator transcription factor, partial [Terracoccus sp.]